MAMSQPQPLEASKDPQTAASSPDNLPVSPIFKDADADILVRSSDDVLFRLHKFILAKASSVFAGMLTIPQPSEASNQEGKLQISQAVHLTEPSAVLHHLLQHIYPVKRPVVRRPAEVRDMLEAARKYEINTVIAIAKGILLSQAFLEQYPLEVYALACGYGLKDVARAAARQSLNVPLPGPFIPELEWMTAASFHRLLAYRDDCRTAALKVPGVQSITKWLGSRKAASGEPHNYYYNNYTTTGGPKSPPNCSCHGPCTGVGHKYIQCWWLEYIEQAKDTLKKKPVGALVKSTTALDPPMQMAAKCNECVKVAFSQLTAYAEVLAAEVEEAVSKVVLTQ